MNKKDLRIAIARHQQFIDRATTMIDTDASGGALPEESQFYQPELESFDSSMSKFVAEALGRTPADDEWIRPGSYAFANQPTGEQWERMGWVKTYRHGLQMSKRYFEALLLAASDE
jgi:hypothetical protein